MKYYAYFNSKYAPCGFLLVPENAEPYDDSKTILVQSDWEFAGYASSMGWQACACGGTDGTVKCEACGKTDVAAMLADALDYIESHAGELFDDPGYFDLA